LRFTGGSVHGAYESLEELAQLLLVGNTGIKVAASLFGLGFFLGLATTFLFSFSLLDTLAVEFSNSFGLSTTLVLEERTKEILLLSPLLALGEGSLASAVHTLCIGIASVIVGSIKLKDDIGGRGQSTTKQFAWSLVRRALGSSNLANSGKLLLQKELGFDLALLVLVLSAAGVL
jgi:hypothetical protein